MRKGESMPQWLKDKISDTKSKTRQNKGPKKKKESQARDIYRKYKSKMTPEQLKFWQDRGRKQ